MLNDDIYYMYFVYTLITTNLFFALFLFWGRTDRYTFFVVELVKKLEIWNYIIRHTHSYYYIQLLEEGKNILK